MSDDKQPKKQQTPPPSRQPLPKQGNNGRQLSESVHASKKPINANMSDTTRTTESFINKIRKGGK